MDTLFGAQPKRRKSWRFWLFALSPLLFLGMCGTFMMQSKQASLEAGRQVALFHQRLESAQYDAIYGDAAPDFQITIQPTALSKYLGAIHEKMGACQAPAQAVTSSFNTNTTGATVLLRYRTSCSNGRLDETFVFAQDRWGTKLLRYQASSPFLMK
jgi:hypothetical protein